MEQAHCEARESAECPGISEIPDNQIRLVLSGTGHERLRSYAHDPSSPLKIHVMNFQWFQAPRVFNVGFALDIWGGGEVILLFEKVRAHMRMSRLEKVMIE